MSGGCKMLSLGHGCECPLCMADKLQYANERLTKLEADLKAARTKIRNITEEKSGIKDSNRKLLDKIRKLELENTKLQQENSFVRHRSCGIKTTYDVRVVDLWAAKNNQRAYRCKFCNGWHLASKKKNEKESAK